MFQNKYNLVRFDVGELVVKKGETIDVTDPSYEKDVWCRKNDIHVEQGTYRCFTFRDEKNIYGWGKRPWANMIVLDEPSILKKAQDEKSWVDIGEEIGVDAGLAGYFINKPDLIEQDAWLNFLRECKAFDIDYKKDKGHYFYKGKDGRGFFTGSGAGDGGYRLFALVEDGRTVGLALNFLE